MSPVARQPAELHGVLAPDPADTAYNNHLGGRAMHAQLHDLRLLYLAHQVELAFEGLEKALHRHLPPSLQAALQPLFQGGPNHHRLEARLKSLNAEVHAREAEIPVADLLKALAECERTSRRFYLDHAAELSDPTLAQLFRGLAEEEATHLDAVERAMAMAHDGT